MYYLANKLNFSRLRWSVLSRILAAMLGGYGLAITSSLFVSQLFMTSAGKYQAIHIGLMLTFFVYACAAMWVFSVATATKAWLGLIKLTLFFSITTWLLMQFNGAAN